jgi:lipoprotein-anchoring transpeptidase ErfK/SrfK
LHAVRSRWLVVVALAIVCLLVAGFAYDSSRSNTIAKGIKIGGVDVGGMSASQARARLHAAYASRLSRPVWLTFANHRYKLSAQAAQLNVDVNGSVQKAVDRTQSSFVLVRVFRSLTGGSINSDLGPQLSYSKPAVNDAVQRIAHNIDRPARDARIGYTSNSLRPIPSETGLRVRTSRLLSAIEGTLAHGIADRHLPIPVAQMQPKVTSSQLKAKNPTIITVDRNSFTLRLWRHLKLAKSYTIAVGQQGLETPAGLYHIQDKEVDPSWHVPNSSWAGGLAGQTIPPGPQDPLKARWMGIYAGAGIHGTEDLGSLGSAASHGCIRMAIPDVVELYSKTPMGTPVYIV